MIKRSDEVHIQKLLSFDLPGRAFWYNPFSFSAWGAFLPLQKKRCVYVITHLSSCHWTLLWRGRLRLFLLGGKLWLLELKPKVNLVKKRRFFQDDFRPTKMWITKIYSSVPFWDRKAWILGWFDFMRPACRLDFRCIFTSMMALNDLNCLKWPQCPQITAMASMDINVHSGLKWPKKYTMTSMVLNDLNSLKWPQWPQMTSMTSIDVNVHSGLKWPKVYKMNSIDLSGLKWPQNA